MLATKSSKNHIQSRVLNKRTYSNIAHDLQRRRERHYNKLHELTPPNAIVRAIVLDLVIAAFLGSIRSNDHRCRACESELVLSQKSKLGRDGGEPLENSGLNGGCPVARIPAQQLENTGPECLKARLHVSKRLQVLIDESRLLRNAMHEIQHRALCTKNPLHTLIAPASPSKPPSRPRLSLPNNYVRPLSSLSSLTGCCTPSSS